jgi:hypothetical protein
MTEFLAGHSMDVYTRSSRRINFHQPSDFASYDYIIHLGSRSSYLKIKKAHVAALAEKAKNGFGGSKASTLFHEGGYILNGWSEMKKALLESKASFHKRQVQACAELFDILGERC